MIVDCWKLLQIWTVLLTLGYILGKTVGLSKSEVSTQSAAPYFEDTSIREVEAAIGQTLLLPCTVKMLGDKVVSWIRTKDLHILTSGTLTFSADSRFESVHSNSRDFWGLRIRGARIADTGQYECQVNTDPKMSFAINLTVTGKPSHKLTTLRNKATILDGKEVHVRQGAPVILTCEVSPLQWSQPQGEHEYYFFPTKSRMRWFHGEDELSFESERGGISVETEYTKLKATSRLRISSVGYYDEGSYTCTFPNTISAAIHLIVSESEHSELMQMDFPSQSATSTNKFNIILSCCILMVNICLL